MTDAEVIQFRLNLASQFPTVPQAWIASVIDNTIDVIAHAGATPLAGEVESVARRCLHMRTSLAL